MVYFAHCYDPLPLNQHQFIFVHKMSASVQLVMCVINQLYQTGVNDHQFHMWVESLSLTETESAV